MDLKSKNYPIFLFFLVNIFVKVIKTIVNMSIIAMFINIGFIVSNSITSSFANISLLDI